MVLWNCSWRRYYIKQVFTTRGGGGPHRHVVQFSGSKPQVQAPAGEKAQILGVSADPAPILRCQTGLGAPIWRRSHKPQGVAGSNPGQDFTSTTTNHA